MSAATQACAPSGATWDGINWAKVQRHVRGLQTRMVKASQAGRHNKVKALQWLLTHSFSGRALAVKRVTENQGRNTPGVDKVTWKTPVAKTNAIRSIKRRGYSPLPLRRVYIPKKNGKTRPLGIPCMIDRAQQALYLLALEPIAETTADPNSYGFRPKRATADAGEQCFVVLSRKASAQWVLEADIKSCFDQISHDWMVANIPIRISTRTLPDRRRHSARGHHFAGGGQHDIGWYRSDAGGEISVREVQGPENAHGALCG